MSEATAQLVLAALRKGRTLDSICGGRLNGRHAPGEKITYYPLYRNYCAAHPDFSREAGALLAENTKAANARKGARHRNMTHCSYGHPFEGTNLHYLPDGRRLCQTCQRRRNANPRPPSEAQIREATAAFNAKKTVNEICHRVVAGKKTEKRILTFRKLKLYRKLNPEFDRFVASVIDSSNSRGQKRRVNPNKARLDAIRAQNDDYKNIFSMIPSYLSPDDRDSVAELISVALYEGLLQRDQVKSRIQQFVRAHNRDANKHGTGKYGLRSLEAKLYDDGVTTLGDTISRGLWD